MSRDQAGLSPKGCEGLAKRCVTLVGGRVEPVVRCHLPRHFPDWLDGIQLRRVRRESVQFDPVPILSEPLFAFRWKVVAGRIVDDEEDLAPAILGYQSLQERPEGPAVEHVGKPVSEVGVRESNGREQVGGLPHPIRVNARLAADARPRSVQRAIEPEAGFVLKQNYPAARSGFFLICGNVVRSQYSWRSRSARASRLRGRCTENPSLCSSRGM